MEFEETVSMPAPTRFSIAGGFALAVVVASMMWAPAVPFAQQGPLGLVGFDKWVHFGSYAGIMFLFAWAFHAKSMGLLLAIAFATFLLGAGVELIQSTIPYRTMNAADVVANGAGVVFALGVWEVIRPRLPLESSEQVEEDASPQ